MNTLQICSIVSMALLCPPACSMRHDSGANPRVVQISHDELTESRELSGSLQPEITVTILTRRYLGKSTGFWGAETTPPRDILWTCQISNGGKLIEIPRKYLQDLAAIVENDDIVSITEMNLVSRRIWLESDESGYLLTLRGGDGVWAYTAEFRISQSVDSLVQIKRKVWYEQTR